jgi:cytochrome c peroxidase
MKRAAQAASILAILLIAADEPAVTFSDSQRARIRRHSPLPAPPPDPTNRFADDPAAAHLGQYLFFDTRLSGNGALACASCHEADLGLADGQAFGQGVGLTDRHVQSLFNVGHNRWYYWAGEVDSLWSQALRPIEAVNEMDGNRAAVVQLITQDEQLRRAYESVFGPMPDVSDVGRFPVAARPIPDDPDHPHAVAWASMEPVDQHTVDSIYANVGKAIAAYERRLTSRDAPFDTFAAGLIDDDPDKLTALSPSAQRGLQLFVGRANCRICHAGPNFTDGEFHNLGLPEHDGGMPRDSGRFDGARKVQFDRFNAKSPFSDEQKGEGAMQLETLIAGPEQWGQFKTPSLRSVALTGPYMHQGQFTTLQDVVEYYSTLEQMVQMGHHQEVLLQPLNLTDQEEADLVAFLRSLTGQPLDPALLSQPAHPWVQPPRAD